MTAAFYQNETKFYVAVDCIILGFDQKELNVLLYKRKFEPMMGQWSLMGGFIKAGESIGRPPHACLPTVLALIIFLWNR